jgi:hypothetical protein
MQSWVFSTDCYANCFLLIAAELITGIIKRWYVSKPRAYLMNLQTS